MQRCNIGYDPQYDPEIYLTPLEALQMMAKLRDVNENDIWPLSNAILSVLDMWQHANKSVSKLSGGNKRKLALGMSIIGNPKLLVLDEPTAGVDPLARRGVWDLLKALRERNKSSIVISSHAMEECEAICDRIAIMAGGKIRCIGSFQHLRTKFCQGTTIRVQIGPHASASPMFSGSSESFYSRDNDDDINASAAIDKLHEVLKQAFGCENVRVVDKIGNGAVFSLVDASLKNSFLFKTMSALKKNMPSLDLHVFESLAVGKSSSGAHSSSCDV